MAVNALEHNALSVQAHQAIFQFKAAEAHVLPNDLAALPLLVIHSNPKLIQAGRFRAPLAGLFYRQLGGYLAGNGVSPGFRHHSFVLLQCKTNAPFFGCGYLCRDLQQTVAVVVIQERADFQILYIHGGYRVQEYIPEQAAETEKILILGPAARAPAIHPAGQLVPTGPQVGRQIKIVGREAVAAEAHVLPVKPQRHAAFRALEGDSHRHVQHGFRQHEGFYIASHRIKALGNLARHNVLAAVPGILDIAVLRNTITFHLDMGGHGNIRPGRAVVFQLFKAGKDLFFVQRIEKLPRAVQAQPQPVFARLQILQAGEGLVIRVGGEAVFAEKFRAFKLFIMKIHSSVLTLLLVGSILLSRRWIR